MINQFQFLIMLGSVFHTLTFLASGQTNPPLEEQITQLWRESNHAQLATLLDTHSATTPPDRAALYCSKFFYLFVQPNKAKALAAVTKLKALSLASNNPDFVAFAERELAEVQGIPDAEFVAATPEVLLLLHMEWPDSFPNIEMAVRVRLF
jgi:hypothetical protein